MTDIAEVRSLFEARVQNGIPNPPGDFHPNDLENRVKNDNYIRRVIKHHDNDLTAAADMLWEICLWRKTVNANEITDSNIKMDYVKEGGTFPRGRDIDNSLLLIFRCKLHSKGVKDFEELKKCMIYWFNRIEREENGKPITLFFDMESCGVSNMDMEFIKYLITLMKYYYPSFLNYIIIYQMPWVLTAAFKLVKALLPAQAVAKMKFLNKDSLKDFVVPEQALSIWGGLDNYTFEFVPEYKSSDQPSKKVTFAEQGDSQHSPGEMMKLVPNDFIVFALENDELSGTLTITNMDESAISFKIRTTSPEKFRVRPSTGTLAPGASATVSIVVQPGYQMRNVSKDRFLVMSVQIPTTTLSPQEMTDVWRQSSGSKVDEFRLKCVFPDKELAMKNGALPDSTNEKTMSDKTSLKALEENFNKMNRQMNLIKIYQLITMLLTSLAVFLAILLYKTSNSNEGHCERM